MEGWCVNIHLPKRWIGSHSNNSCYVCGSWTDVVTILIDGDGFVDCLILSHISNCHDIIPNVSAQNKPWCCFISKRTNEWSSYHIARIVRGIKVSWCFRALSLSVTGANIFIFAFNTPKNDNIAAEVKQIGLGFSCTSNSCWENWDWAWAACCVTATKTLCVWGVKWISWFYVFGNIIKQVSIAKCVIVEEEVAIKVFCYISTWAISIRICIVVKNCWNSLEEHTSENNLGLID